MNRPDHDLTPTTITMRTLRTTFGALLSLLAISCFAFSGCAVETVPEDEEADSEPVEEAEQAITECGDNYCWTEAGESTATCCEDCGSMCGDGECNCFETSSSCPQDCGTAPPEPTCPPQSCRNYYGTCTGWYGTSCAEGEGWRYCATGGFLYAFITICGPQGSYPSSYGQGACAW